MGELQLARKGFAGSVSIHLPLFSCVCSRSVPQTQKFADHILKDDPNYRLDQLFHGDCVQCK